MRKIIRLTETNNTFTNNSNRPMYICKMFQGGWTYSQHPQIKSFVESYQLTQKGLQFLQKIKDIDNIFNNMKIYEYIISPENDFVEDNDSTLFDDTLCESNKVIRLTESDLHKIIKEAINELDWKTYMNAAKARYDSGNYKSSDKLLKHAQQQFNQKHGLENSFYGPGIMYNNTGHDINFKVGLQGGCVTGREGDEDKSVYGRYIADEHGMFNDKYGWTTHGGYGHGNSKEYYRQLDNASHDIKDYYSKYNKTPYIKGKGWVK